MVSFYFLHPIKIPLTFLSGFLGGEVPHPEIFQTWKMLHMGFLFIAIAVIFYKATSNKNKEGKFVSNILGSADWLKEKEAKAIFKNNLSDPGILFGTNKGNPVILPADVRGNRNVVVVGPPGTGKSRAYVRNNLFQAVVSGWSVVVTDPKGELTQDFKIYLEGKGYKVKLFNLVDMAHSHRWNPLSEIKTDINAQTFCEVIIANTAAAAGKKGGDPFWDRAETNLLKALVLYVVNEFPEEKRNLGEMYKILAHSDPKHMHNIFSTLPYNHPAKMPFNIYAETSDQVRSGVIIGLGTRLQVFQNKMIRSLTEESDIVLSDPGKEKCAYFCIVSDTDHTFDFLASLFFSFLFIGLTRTADHNGGELEIPVNFLLDEFCNIGHIPDFTKKISTMRSRGIACSVIFQAIGQLENHYPDKAWETIMADCDSWLILGAKDITTAEYISRYMGVGTIKVVSKTKPLGDPFSQGSQTLSLRERRLMNSDEIIRLPRDEAILSAFGSKPFRINKMDFSLHPESDRLIPQKINEFRPDWSSEYLGGKEYLEEKECLDVTPKQINKKKYAIKSKATQKLVQNKEEFPEIYGDEINPLEDDDPIKYNIDPVEEGISRPPSDEESSKKDPFFC